MLNKRQILIIIIIACYWYVPKVSAVTWEKKELLGDLNHIIAIDGSSADHIWCVGAWGLMGRYESGTDSWLAAPKLTRNTLWSIDVFSDTAAWAVGDFNTILFYNGSSWTHDVFDFNGIHIRGVHAIDEDDVWACADEGYVLHWDGVRWSPQLVNASETWFGITATDARHVWLCSGSFRQTIYFFNGQSWTEQDNPNAGSMNDLQEIHAVDAANVWAIGNNGRIFRYLNGRWQRSNSGGERMLIYIDGLNPASLWIAANKDVLHWGGMRWSSQRDYADPDMNIFFNSVYAADANNVWLAADEGILFHSSDADVSDCTGTLEPPKAPQCIVPVEGDSFVELTWDPVNDLNIVYYSVFRAEQPYGPFIRLERIWTPRYQYTDTQAKNGKLYYYTIISTNVCNQDSTANFLEQAAPHSSTDSDADGLPDDWERAHFGNLAHFPRLDFDGDGLSNIDEYNAAHGQATCDLNTTWLGGTGHIAGSDPKVADSDRDFVSDLRDPLPSEPFIFNWDFAVPVLGGIGVAMCLVLVSVLIIGVYRKRCLADSQNGFK